MKIVVIVMVKNESDIVESFIRYNSAFADAFVICDNGSTDGTVGIIGNLIRDGYSIILTKNPKSGYYQSETMTELLRVAVRAHDPDWIVPLDADEFLVAKGGGNPREKISRLSPDKAHLLAWQTFVPTPKDDVNERFIPRRIQFKLLKEQKVIRKVIVPRRLAVRKNIRLLQGNHGLFSKTSFERIEIDNLGIAHFPIRTVGQAVSKFTIGWLNYLTMPNQNSGYRKHGRGWHWKEGFAIVKQYPDLDSNEILDIGRRYAGEKNKRKGIIGKFPMDLSFLKDAEVRFTPIIHVNPFERIVSHAESMAMEIARFRQMTGNSHRLGNDDDFVLRAMCAIRDRPWLYRTVKKGAKFVFLVRGMIR